MTSEMMYNRLNRASLIGKENADDTTSDELRSRHPKKAEKSKRQTASVEQEGEDALSDCGRKPTQYENVMKRIMSPAAKTLCTYSSQATPQGFAPSSRLEDGERHQEKPIALRVSVTEEAQSEAPKEKLSSVTGPLPEPSPEVATVVSHDRIYSAAHENLVITSTDRDHIISILQKLEEHQTPVAEASDAALKAAHDAGFNKGVEAGHEIEEKKRKPLIAAAEQEAFKRGMLEADELHRVNTKAQIKSGRNLGYDVGLRAVSKGTLLEQEIVRRVELEQQAWLAKANTIADERVKQSRSGGYQDGFHDGVTKGREDAEAELDELTDYRMSVARKEGYRAGLAAAATINNGEIEQAKTLLRGLVKTGKDGDVELYAQLIERAREADWLGYEGWKHDVDVGKNGEAKKVEDTSLTDKL